MPVPDRLISRTVSEYSVDHSQPDQVSLDQIKAKMTKAKVEELKKQAEILKSRFQKEEWEAK